MIVPAKLLQTVRPRFAVLAILLRLPSWEFILKRH
jgi:hypothetical protein